MEWPSALKDKLAAPPKDWADAVIAAVLKNPWYYSRMLVFTFVVIALIALWATWALLDEIKGDEARAEKEKQRAEQEREEHEKKAQ